MVIFKKKKNDLPSKVQVYESAEEETMAIPWKRRIT